MFIFICIVKNDNLIRNNIVLEKLENSIGGEKYKGIVRKYIKYIKDY